MLTSEAVTPKHPDKICDAVADAMVDAAIGKAGKDARAAFEFTAGHGSALLVGESSADITENEVAAAFEKTSGIEYGYRVYFQIAKQSPFIAKGVDAGGAGDQGIMVGYATAETPEMLPIEHALAKRLCRRLYAKYPVDGKVQVSVSRKFGKPFKVMAVVASFCGVKGKTLEKAVRKEMTEAAAGLADVDGMYVMANTAGDWDRGGLDADSGTTGRKIVQDAYGPRVPVGGGAFSGKDWTKVDRSAALMARKMAVDAVSVGARECTVSLSYGIGKAHPISARVETAVPVGIDFRTYDITPEGIRRRLKLDEVKWSELAPWGPFDDMSRIWNKPSFKE